MHLDPASQSQAAVTPLLKAQGVKTDWFDVWPDLFGLLTNW